MMKSKIANLFATYFGLGLSKFAPGTMGSLGTLPLAYALIYFGGFGALLIAAIIIFPLGVMATHIVIKETRITDPSKVVIDETVGQLLAFVPLAYVSINSLLGYESFAYYLCGFLFFRLFDIKKMGPVKYFDSRVLNAYGVMLDDVCAGIFAGICLYGVWHYHLLAWIY